MKNDTIDEMIIIESLKKEKMIDINNMMKNDEVLENFDCNHENKGFSDEIDSKINDNNDNY